MMDQPQTTEFFMKSIQANFIFVLLSIVVYLTRFINCQKMWVIIPL